MVDTITFLLQMDHNFGGKSDWKLLWSNLEEPSKSKNNYLDRSLKFCVQDCCYVQCLVVNFEKWGRNQDSHHPNNYKKLVKQYIRI